MSHEWAGGSGEYEIGYDEVQTPLHIHEWHTLGHPQNDCAVPSESPIRAWTTRREPQE